MAQYGYIDRTGGAARIYAPRTWSSARAVEFMEAVRGLGMVRLVRIKRGKVRTLAVRGW